VSVQIAWCGRGKETLPENGPISDVDRADGTQLLNTANDSDLSSDDELFGLLDKSGADRQATNGNCSVREKTGNASHGVRQYVGNMSSMLSGINLSHSTVVQ